MKIALKKPPTVRGVTIVENVKQAEKVLDVLFAHPDNTHCLDTETTGVNPKIETPVGNGRVICLSAFLGPEVDFGNGPRLWVDTLQDTRVIEAFRPYLEWEEENKVWHNYWGFDRHVILNHGVQVAGLHADSLHMARLQDPSSVLFSLEHLTEKFAGRTKLSMKKLFGQPVTKKDGTPGKKIEVPSTLELQTTPRFRPGWIDYSTYDTEGLWYVFKALKALLERMPWVARLQTNMWDFYQKWWKDLGLELSNMERRGFTIDGDHLREIRPIAESDLSKHEAAFKAWASEYVPDALHLNLSSDKQLQTLLFGGEVCTSGYGNKKTQVVVEDTRAIKILNVEGYIAPGKKKPLKYREVTITSLGLPHDPQELTDSGYPKTGKAVINGLCGIDASGNQRPEGSVVYKVFGGGKEGLRAAKAFAHLAQVSQIGILLSNFIIPLPTFQDSNGRIHPRVDVATETGRLSMKRPNGQNQPAVAKDRYHIRDAWIADLAPNPFDGLREGFPEDYCLGVWDYSQLELRVLAHLANCKDMIDAFDSGLDLHSRTALMFDEVKEAVESGVCYIDKSQGTDKPDIKTMFRVHRDRSKIVNFSVAYGKTEYGFAKDWQVSVQEARAVIDDWYSLRPEVREWQARELHKARNTGYVRTLLGRYRPVAGINSNNKAVRRAYERRVGNTPVQGGAADIVNSAMVLIGRDRDIARMGWRMLLQVHDELVLSGPRRHAEEAAARITGIMSNPFGVELRVPLVVEGGTEMTWALAK